MKNYVIVHVPHASSVLPPGHGIIADVTDELRLVTDWRTDDLFASREQVAFPWSRLFCDVERLIPDPLDEVGQGFAYRRMLDGTFLREVGPDMEVWLRTVYDQHHVALVGAIEKAVSLMPVMIVDAHSFSAEQASLSGDRTDPLQMPDICIGHNRGSLPDKFLWGLRQHFLDAGWSVLINQPYQGAIMPERYAAHPDVRSVMLEVNKRIYLEPGTSEPNRAYPRIREILQGALSYIEAYDFAAEAVSAA